MYQATLSQPTVADRTVAICMRCQNQARILSSDQEIAVERLRNLLRACSQATEATLPERFPPCWSVPMIIGPPGAGKTFVCQEFADRSGRLACRRWEIGNWMIRTGQTTRNTLDQIEHFIQGSRIGAVVYLAGLDSLTVPSKWGTAYYHAVVSEIAGFFDTISRRDKYHEERNSCVPSTPVTVILGARFDTWWKGVRGAQDVEATDHWKYTDRDVRSIKPKIAAAWVAEHSGLPADILRRVTTEPLLLQPLSDIEAKQLAVRLQQDLPPSLDGVGVEELTDALLGPQGWRGVGGVIEQAFAAGYEDIVIPSLEKDDGAKTLPVNARPVRPRCSSQSKLSRVAHQRRLPTQPSALLLKAQRLGLNSPAALIGLAEARDYTLNQNRTCLITLSFVEKVEEFSDLELMLSLLSPYFPYDKSAVCRGALMLRALFSSLGAKTIVSEACKEHAEWVVRHIALLGYRFEPKYPGWKDVLILLPITGKENPGFAEGALPDHEIVETFRSLAF